MGYKKLMGTLLILAAISIPSARGENQGWPKSTSYWYDVDGDGVMEWALSRNSSGLYKFSSDYKSSTKFNSDLSGIFNWFYFNKDNNIDCSGGGNKLFLGKVGNRWEDIIPSIFPDLSKNIAFNPIDFNNNGSTGLLIRDRYSSSALSNYALSTDAHGNLIKEKIEILTPEQYANTRKDLNLSVGGDGIPGWDDMFGRDPVSDPKSLGSYSALDINGDGLPDFVDYDNGTYFLNTGDGRLVQSSFGANAFFRDLNGDGICDYIIYDSAEKTIKAYIVNRGAEPTEVLLMKGLDFDSNLWCYDFDRDGDVDILIPFNSSKEMPGFLVMLENIGNSKFKQHEYALDNNVLIKECADIDADGNYEVLAFYNCSENNQVNVIYYEVQGISIKTEHDILATDVPKGSFFEKYYYSLYTADFDGSGKTRIFTGSSDYETNRWFEPFPKARNQAPTAPAKPELTFDEATGRLSIRWTPANDKESSSVDLTYELRIGTTETGGEILRAHAKINGKRLNLIPGANGHSCFRVIDTKSWPTGRYYISVQAIDPAGLGSPFSTSAVFVKNQPLASFSILAREDFAAGDTATVVLPSVPASSDELLWKWGDAKIIESAADRTQYRIAYTEGGIKNIELQVRSSDGVLSVPHSRSIEVSPAKFRKTKDGLSPNLAVDLDGDGVQEILYNGKLYDCDKSGSYNPVKKIYNTNLELLSTTQVCDLNRDGKPDLISYSTSNSYMTKSRALINIGGKGMEKGNLLESWAPPLNYNMWVDINNDGLNELFAYNGFIQFSDNYTKYKYISAEGIPFDEYGYITVVPLFIYDYDNDGLLDVIVRDTKELLLKIYRNNGDNTFSLLETLYAGEPRNVRISDIDGDGKADFPYCNGGYGFGVTSYKEYAFIHFGNGKVMKIQCPDGNPFKEITDIFDIDNNGCNDLIINSQSGYTIVYIYPDYSYSTATCETLDGIIPFYDATGVRHLGPNVAEGRPNTRPTAPGEPRATQNAKSVIIEWNAATDAETPQGGLRYNISIRHKGADGDGAYFISPLNEGIDGVRLPYPARLLNSTRFTIPLQSIAPGEYEVKVQAVDGVYEVSNFSQTCTFTVKANAVVDMPLSAMVGDEVVIKFISNISDAEISYDTGAELIKLDANECIVRWNTPGRKCVRFGDIAQSDIYIHPLPDGEFVLPETILCGANVVPTGNNTLVSEWEVAADNGDFSPIEKTDAVKLITDSKGNISFMFGKTGAFTLRRTVKTEYGTAIFTSQTQVTDINARPEIDRVDIDAASGKYAVRWTIPAELLPKVKSVNIFKEGTRIDDYSLIATVAPNDRIYIDNLSTPSVRGARYCISYVLEYGESQYSTAHQSVHLMLNTAPSGWNLMWSRYDGRIVESYRILRGTSADALSTVTEVSGNMASYTDTQAPDGELFYAVEPVFSTTQSVSRSSTESVQSNVVSTLKALSGVAIESICIVTDKEASLEAGENDALYLRTNIMPVNATFRKINWVVTEGADIASIDANGILRSISDKGGAVTVTAYATDGSGVFDTMDILMVVTPDEPEGPIFDPPGKHYIYTITTVH